MSKTWTALAFMQLVDEGKVALDEPVRAYLPGFRVSDLAVSARVTPRQLLNHTNGIEEAYGEPGEGDDVYERMVANIVDAPQVFPLGETHGYSAALGYAILARIMEVIDARRWDAIMQERLFGPLGLASTSSRREDVDAARAAAGHLLRSLDQGPVVSPIASLPRAYGPGGNLSSSVRDVSTMAHVFLDEGRALDRTRIVSPEGVREMMRSGVPIPDPYMVGHWWGLGLVVCEWGGETVYAHDGSTIGQNARLRILPDRDLAVAMLTNGGPRRASTGRRSTRSWPSSAPSRSLSCRYPIRRSIWTCPGTSARTSGRAFATRCVPQAGTSSSHSSGIPGRPASLGNPSARPTSYCRSARRTSSSRRTIRSRTQTVAIYDFQNGAARYLHTNCRVFPRASN